MTIRNLGEFNRWIDRVNRDFVPERFETLQRVIALGLFRNIVRISPVGNPDRWKDPSSAPPGYVGGRFRGNWQVGASPAAAATDDIDPTGALANARAASVLSPGSPLVGIGRTIWLFNNVPYAERLEDGWSTVAPDGVVNVAIRQLLAENP